MRGSTFSYTELGRGIPLLALSGSPGDARQTLAAFEPAFVGRTGWRRLHLDLPGQGRTPGPDWIRTYDDVLQAVVEFLDEVVGDQPVAVAGISYGSTLATALRHGHPERVLATLQLSPANDVEPDGLSTPVVREDTGFREALTEDERPFLDLFKVRTRTVLEEIRAWTMPGVASCDVAFLDRLDQGPRFSHVDEPLRSFDGPGLIIVGRQDPGGHHRLVDQLDLMPRTTLAVLDRAGHLAFAEQSRLVDVLVTEWLDRVEEHLEQTRAARL
ncbi:alpha/beta fold hydrolase [Friedmanniella luteola]|uniref:alpha/beta fold hydrolase n=1 Tax=Friedmanniella luteola TaxID=546871 RepID=UPI0012FD329C|nr:alpha/beta hydrolase [Friedmanniella luteola]